MSSTENALAVAVETRLTQLEAMCAVALLIVDVDEESEYDGCWDIHMHDWQPYHKGETQQYPVRADLGQFIAAARTLLPAALAHFRGVLERWRAAEANLAQGEGWWCPQCACWVACDRVTFQEEHDRRYGGCGNTVLDGSISPAAHTVAALRAELASVAEALGITAEAVVGAEGEECPAPDTIQ